METNKDMNILITIDSIYVPPSQFQDAQYLAARLYNVGGDTPRITFVQPTNSVYTAEK